MLWKINNNNIIFILVFIYIILYLYWGNLFVYNVRGKYGLFYFNVIYLNFYWEYLFE